MFRSFPVGRLFGITVRIHALFVAMLVVVMMVWPQLALALPILFGCVLLHELGHSLVAQRFGIRVLDITLWPLGGMARMSTIPEEPRIEALIAISGPAVNFALAALALPLLLVTGPMIGLVHFFVAVNLLMGVFNLLPAFPMDGGRLLRAYLGRRRDWVSATERAVRVGRIFALVMLLSWPFFGYNPVLPLIALFVWFTGSQELMGVRLRHGLVPFGGFGDRSRPAPLFGSLFGWGPAAGAEPEEFRSASFDLRGARPVAGETAAPDGTVPRGGSAGGGFSAEEIERLERFPGRLGQFRAGDGNAPR